MSTTTDLARRRGGCGEVINVDAWCDGDAVPSTAGLCDSPEKHREHAADVTRALDGEPQP